MAANHLDNFSFTFTLSPSPPTRAGFGNLLIIAPLATNSLNGDTTRSYASATEAQVDLTAGYIEQVVYDRVALAFTQDGKPSAVKVGAVDLVGVEGWDEAFTRILAADPDFYAVCITSRTAADIVSIGTQIEAEGTRQLFFQSSDADWLTTGVPAAFSTMAAFERSSLIFHDDDTEFHDIAWVADRLSADPDETSADWKALIKGATALTTGLTTAQKGFLEDTNNGNVALELGPAYELFVDPGQNLNGRSIYEILTVDWYRARVREDMAQLFVTLATERRKLVVGAQGQVQVQGVLDGRLQQGANMPSPHFIRGQTRVTPQAIVQADLDNEQMRFKIEAQIAQSARKALFDIYFQNSPLAAE